jgi:hypothetical protein
MLNLSYKTESNSANHIAGAGGGTMSEPSNLVAILLTILLPGGAITAFVGLILFAHDGSLLLVFVAIGLVMGCIGCAILSGHGKAP